MVDCVTVSYLTELETSLKRAILELAESIKAGAGTSELERSLKAFRKDVELFDEMVDNAVKQAEEK